MGFADNIKNAVEKGKEYASQNTDKADGFVDKAGDLIDQKTGDKYADKIDQAQDAAKKQYHEGEQAPADQAPADAPAEEASAPEQDRAAEAPTAEDAPAPDQAPAPGQ